MIFWTFANTFGALTAAAFVFWLTVFRRWSPIERVALTLMIVGLILRVGPITGKAMGTISPYDDWPATALQIGLCMFAWRLWKRFPERSLR